MHLRSLLILMLTSLASAQWHGYKTPGIPRTKSGAPNLSAPVPKARDGKPDLSGLWIPGGSGREEIERLFPGIRDLAVPGDDAADFSKYFFDVLVDFRETPLEKPATATLVKQRMANQSRDDSPSAHCQPASVPMLDVLPFPFKIVQTPGQTLILYEADNTFRQIYTDGRKYSPDLFPTWMGYAVGRWEGGTFVVETVGFNDRAWLDGIGHPRSEKLHLTERFRRRDFGHMDLEVTIDDPELYTRPWTIKSSLTLLPDTDLLEVVCTENEKDQRHLETR